MMTVSLPPPHTGLDWTHWTSEAHAMRGRVRAPSRCGVDDVFFVQCKKTDFNDIIFGLGSMNSVPREPEIVQTLKFLPDWRKTPPLHGHRSSIIIHIIQ